jgi:hypothetical protein
MSLHVWKEIETNPNIYCWVPASKKDKKLEIEDMNIQDVPPAIKTDYEDMLAQLAEESHRIKQQKIFKKLESKDYGPEDLVSADDPRKYPIVKDFIIRKGLKLYGGVAINAYLPKEAKIYNPTDLPDYDFFSPDPWNDAVELADIFRKKGYAYIEAKAGIHKGTYKVFVNMWPVADITFMNQKDFDKLKTKTINGMKIVSPFALLESMYKEFSLPFSNPDRWPKVSSREKLLQKWVKPLEKKLHCSNSLFSTENPVLNPVHSKLLEISEKFILEHKLVFCGPTAYNIYVKVGNGKNRITEDFYEVLSEQAQKHANDLFTKLMPVYSELEITTLYKACQELNNTEYSIYAVIQNEFVLICSFVEITVCTPFLNISGKNIVSIDYLKYELYNCAVFCDTEQETVDAKCKIKYISELQEQFYKKQGINELDKSPFQRFVLNCKGPARNNVKVEIINRWLDRIANKENVQKIHTKKYRVVKIPREKVPKECEDKPKDLCRYPCGWNKFIGKCSGIPKGAYRPGEENFDLKYEYE